MAIDNDLTITDTDAPVVGDQINSATVSISAGFFAGDQLNFTNQNGITGSYNIGTGVLTLTGPATLAEYEAALRSITFSSTSDNPTNSGANASRTVTWTVKDTLDIESSPVTSTVTVTGVNDPHTGGVSITGTATEDQVLTAVSTLADPDGLGTLHYQWQRDIGGGFVNVGARPGDLHAGRRRRRRRAGRGQLHRRPAARRRSATSAATAAVADVNDAADRRGDDHRHGDRGPGPDRGLDAGGCRRAGHAHYQWQRDVGSGFVNVGADQATYTLGDADVGGEIRVVASYTDGHGTAESVDQRRDRGDRQRQRSATPAACRSPARRPRTRC